MVVVSLWDVQVYVHDRFGKSVSERRTIIGLSAGLGVASIDCASFYYNNLWEKRLIKYTYYFLNIDRDWCVSIAGE